MLDPAAKAFEKMLTGGHPNSLGRTEEVVELVLADQAKLAHLYQCYRSEDDVVRLRVSSAMKRVTIAQPEWVLQIVDDLQSEIAANPQASVQWTLALIFDELLDLLSNKQRKKAVKIMMGNLANHEDWIVLNNSMKVLGKWAKNDVRLAAQLRPHAERLTGDARGSVAKNARKLCAQLSAGA